MKRAFTTWSALLVPALLLLGGASGCMTYEDYRARANAEEQEDKLILQEDMKKLSGRIEGLELETQRLRADLDALRSGPLRNAQSATDSRLNDLDSRLRAVEAAREKDKQEIVDRLSSQVSKIVSSSGSGAAKKQNTKRSGSDTGYEHEVKAGESLSAIAAAYGVTVKTIMDNNDIKDPKRVRVGQKLFIPQ